jgi:hypothetical protein
MFSGLNTCSDVDPEEFFPNLNDFSYDQEVTAKVMYELEAQRLCHGCPVMAECLELALRQEARVGHSDGIRGGLPHHLRQELITVRSAVPRRKILKDTPFEEAA